MAHGVVRTDNLAGIDVGKNLRAVKYHNGTAYAEIDNGMPVVLDAYLGGDVWKAVKPAAGDCTGKLCLIATPEIFYDRERPLNEFVNEADREARAYLLEVGDIFSVTADVLDATPVAGTKAYLEAAAGKWHVAEAASRTESSATINACAELIAIDVVGGLTFYVYHVIK